MFEEMEQFFSELNDNAISTPINTSSCVDNFGASDDTVVNTNNASLLKFYNKLEELGFNLEELKDIFNCKTNQLILSGAGCGKTTALSLKLIHDFLDGTLFKVVEIPSPTGPVNTLMPCKILVSTFLKSGAGELKKAFQDWCFKLGVTGIDYSAITFKTIHAEVYDVIKQLGISINILENGDSVLRGVMNSFGIKSVYSMGKKATNDEVSDISCLVSYARNRLDNERYNHPIMPDYNMDSLLLEALLKAYKQHRLALGKMDFEDMQEMLLEGLQVNPVVRDFISKRYDYVFVDEFQDTSQLQYEILKYYFDAAKYVAVVGDDDQTIYGWRGSDIDIITERFEQDYSPTILNLSTNYRCRQNILNAVIPSIEKNSKRHKKQLKAAKPGGVVNIVTGGDIDTLLDTIREDLKNGSVGVLARTNADLLIPAMLLELDGQHDFTISKSVNLNSRIPSQVIGCMDLITKRFSSKFSDSLKLFINRYNHQEVDKLCAILKANTKASLFNIAMKDIRYSLPNLAPIINGLREACKEDKVLGYIYLLELLHKYAYNGDSIYAQKARDFVYFMKKMIIEHKDLKDMSIEQLDIVFNDVLPDKFIKRIKYSKDVFIKLTTVHEAKGKEWDSVIIWNDVEGCFPNSVGKRDLSIAEYEEERRVHYIAWTRPKDKLTVFTMADRYGAFLKECDLEDKEGVEFEDKVVIKKIVSTKKEDKEWDTSEDELGDEIVVDKILRDYMNYVLSEKSPASELYLNLDLVMNNYSNDTLVEKLINDKYILNYPEEDRNGVVEDLIKDLADSLARL